MKRIIFLILSCILLMSCNENTISMKEYEKLQENYEEMMAKKDSEISEINQSHVKELKSLENELNDNTRAFSIERKALVDKNKHQSKAYENYEQIYDLAKEIVYEFMFEDNVRYENYNYVDSRLDDITFVYFDEILDVYIYKFNYSYKSKTPENIIYEVSMNQKKDGWIQPTYPESNYLIFKEKDYVGHFLINDTSPGQDLFYDDLEDFLEIDALKTIRLDFINGVEIYSFSAMVNINYNMKRFDELRYDVSEEYSASVEGIYNNNFDIYTRVSSIQEVIVEENYETDLGPVKLLTLLSNGEYIYKAFLECSKEEGYLFNYSKEGSSLNTKLEFLSYLKSLKRIELSKYEKIEVEDKIIASANGIRLVMKTGYFTNDSELWNATGPKWYGKYEFQVDSDTGLVSTDFQDVWEEDFFYAPEFEIILKDYNNDGLMDFVLTQYGSSNICLYKMFTITDEGRVIATPFIDYYSMTGHFTRINSPELEIVRNQIVMSFYDNTNILYITNYFKWNGKAYECVLTEKKPY